MAFEWLFGRQEVQGSWVTIPSVVLDIDVARDVYRLLNERYAQALAQASTDPYFPPGTDDLTKVQAYLERTAAIEAAEMLAPKISISPPIERLDLSMVHTSVYVDVDSLDALGEVERAGITITGAGVNVQMRRRVAPQIISLIGDTGQPGSNHDLVMRIADLMVASGTRRPQLRRLVRFAPFLFAFVVTSLGVWALSVEMPGLPTVLFVSAVMLAFWVTAVVVYRPIETKFQNSWPGIRFREGSRSALRERLTNTRATAIVALITTPIAGTIGYGLRALFGG